MSAVLLPVESWPEDPEEARLADKVREEVWRLLRDARTGKVARMERIA